MKRNRTKIFCGVLAGMILFGAPAVSHAAESSEELVKALRARMDALRSGQPSEPAAAGTLPADAEPALRQALRQKMAEIDAARNPADEELREISRPAPEKAGLAMAPQPSPDLFVPSRELARAAAKNSAAAAAPASAGVSQPAPAAKPASALDALTEQYRAGLISPRTYHLERAKLKPGKP